MGKAKIISICFLLLLSIFFTGEKLNAQNSTSLREEVVPVSPKKWERPSPEGSFADDMRYMLRDRKSVV